MINPAKILKMRSAWNTFRRNHPKFQPFLKAVEKNAMEEGTVVEITVTTKEGRVFHTNLKINESDKEILQDMTELFMG